MELEIIFKLSQNMSALKVISKAWGKHTTGSGDHIRHVVSLNIRSHQTGGLINWVVSLDGWSHYTGCLIRLVDSSDNVVSSDRCSQQTGALIRHIQVVSSDIYRCLIRQVLSLNMWFY